MNQRIWNRISAGLLSIVILAGCSTGSSKGVEKSPAPAPAPAQAQEVIVKVGLIGARTGPSAELGAYLDGAVAAFKELNATGGVKSKDGKTIYKFDPIMRDDEANPAKGKELTEELIHKENVVAILGPTNTSNGLQMMPVIVENKVPLISPVSTGTVLMTTAVKLANGGPNWFFRTTTPDAVQAEKMVSYVKAKGFKKIAIMHDSTAYGKGGLAELQGALKAAGLDQNVVVVQEFNMSAPDSTPQVTKVKESGADILLVWALGHDHARVALERKKLGLTIPHLGSTALQQANFRTLAKDAAEGAFSIWPRAHTFPAAGQSAVNPRMQKAYDIYKKHFPQGIALEQWGSAAFAYDSAMIVANAVAEAGTDRVKVRDAIESLVHTNVASKEKITYTKEQHEIWTAQEFAITTVKNGALAETND